MCGRLNVVDAPGVRALCDTLDIDLGRENQIFSRYIGAANLVSIVRRHRSQVIMQPATWWLLLDKTDDGFKPSRYTSINTRYDSLNNPRKAGYRPYREGRIVIPVSGFGESEYRQSKLLHCHDMTAEKGLLLGGLCKEWLHPHTGEIRLSCSVITLPPHPKLQYIHSKSMPLLLSHDKILIDAWLDNEGVSCEAFDYLLSPHLPQPLVVQQIAKPTQFEQLIGQPFTLSADDE